MTFAGFTIVIAVVLAVLLAGVLLAELRRERKAFEEERSRLLRLVDTDTHDVM